MAIDRHGYFSRIGYALPVGRPDATLGTLRDVVAAHNRSIPFENLDPLMGVPVGDLSVEALTDKLVRRRRGGYCYEHNGLLGYVLEDLGFDVQRLGGRVVWMRHDDALPAQTHQVLSVRLPDGAGPYLVDVGFGGQTLTSPIRLLAGPVQQTRHEPYRLLEHAEGFELQAEIGGGWQPLYPAQPASTAADRSRGRKLVCVHAPRVGLRSRTVGRLISVGFVVGLRSRW